MPARILDLHQRGQGYHAIAGKLTEDGVPSKRGGRWHAFTVKKVCVTGGPGTRELSAPRRALGVNVGPHVDTDAECFL